MKGATNETRHEATEARHGRIEGDRGRGRMLGRLVRRDHFNVARGAMLSAVIEHLLGIGNASDQGAHDLAVPENQGERVGRGKGDRVSWPGFCGHQVKSY